MVDLLLIDSSIGANLTYTNVSEVTKGRPSKPHFTLMSEDVPASALPTGATPTKVSKDHDEKHDTFQRTWKTICIHFPSINDLDNCMNFKRFGMLCLT